MEIQHIAAFSFGATGGNPAGVVIEDALPSAEVMQEIATEVGFSETVFAAPKGDDWIVRYFSPESEVPFCGHATIALGAALAMQEGEGCFVLHLANDIISVEGSGSGTSLAAALQSPPTQSELASDTLVQQALELFDYSADDLAPDIPPAIVQAGATHLMLMLNSREKLSQMTYDLDSGREFMNTNNLVTVSFVWAQSAQLFHVRNAFASGGVLEDPATGAAAAALAGHLRKIDWPHGGEILIIQGEDMGKKSVLHAKISSESGSSIHVSGQARIMENS